MCVCRSEENIVSLSVPLHFIQLLKLYEEGYILYCEDGYVFIDVVLAELFVLEEIFGNKKIVEWYNGFASRRTTHI